MAMHITNKTKTVRVTVAISRSSARTRPSGFHPFFLGDPACGSGLQLVHLYHQMKCECVRRRPLPSPVQSKERNWYLL